MAWQGLSKPNLSSREIDEMIDDWTPEPLVPPLSEEETAEAEAMPVRCVCPPFYAAKRDVYLFYVQRYNSSARTNDALGFFLRPMLVQALTTAVLCHLYSVKACFRYWIFRGYVSDIIGRWYIRSTCLFPPRWMGWNVMRHII